MTARSFLVQAGFAGELLDTMLGIEWVECLDPTEVTCTCHPELPARRGLHFYDAVGDIGAVNETWGPSIGAAQIRSLRDPTSGNEADTWRVAEKLRDPLYNAQAARAIAGPNGENFRLWTPWRTGTFAEHLGENFELHVGHRNAHLWNI